MADFAKMDFEREKQPGMIGRVESTHEHLLSVIHAEARRLADGCNIHILRAGMW